MGSQASSNSQAGWYFEKENDIHGCCKDAKATSLKRLKRFPIFTALLVLAASLSSQYTYAEPVACVEGAEPLTVSFGDNTTGCAIDTGADTDTFEFTGNVGDEIRLNLRSLTAGLDPNISLRDPSGAEVATGGCAGGGGLCSFALDHTLALTGTYVVIVGETGLDEMGDFRLQLEKLFPAIAPTALQYDVAVTDTLDPSTDMDFFSFTGNVGDEVRLNLRALTIGLDPNISLRDPGGAEVATGACASGGGICSFALDHTLALTGTYVVIVGETGLDEMGDFRLQLEKLFPAIAPTALQYDVAVTDTLDPSTDMDFFSFTGNVGDEVRLNLRALTVGLDPNISLRDPGGAEVATGACASGGGICSFALDHTLAMTGTYVVIVGETGLDEMGDFRLQLEKLFPAITPTALQYDVAVTDTLDPSTDMDFFSFTGNVGDEIRLNLRALTVGLDPNISLRDPGGAEVATGACASGGGICSFALDHTLALTGTYVVIVGETGLDEMGDFRLQLEKLFPAIAPTALQYDVAVTDTLDPSTDMDFFSFTGNVGDEVRLNLRALTIGLDPNISLRDPGGAEVATGACASGGGICSFALDHTLALTGTYVVIVGETGLDEMGDFRLQLEKLFPAITPTALQYDVAVTDTLDPSTDMDFFSFTGNVGDEVRLNLRALTIGLDPNISLRDPGGAEVATGACASGGGICSFALDHTLALTGTYVVIVGETGLDEMGDFRLQLEKLFPAITPTALQYDVAVTDTLDPSTDMDFFSFTGNVGDEVRLNLRALTIGLDPNISLRDPGGAEVATGACASGGGICSFALDHTLAMTGTYVVIVGETGLDEMGDYEITLECLSIACGAINEPPVVTNPGPQSSTEGDIVSLSIIATDGDTLTYSATGLPAGLAIDPDSGVISGTLDFDTAGPYDVTVSVTDNVNDPVTVNFAWSVAEGNQLPTVTTPGAQDNTEGDAVALQIVANDDNTLTFSATGLPPGIAIDPSSGLISGLLDFNSAGSYDVTVSVDDGVNPPVSTDPFPWTVNDAPPPVPDVNVTNVDFGDVIVGASAFGSFEVSNSGGSPLVVSDVQSSGAPFNVLPPESFTVAPAGISQTVNIGFAPTAEGDFVGSITLVNNTGSPVVVNVTGRGIPESGTGEIDTVDSLEFIDVEELVSVEQVVTVANTGEGLLTINSAATDDPAFEVFTTPGDILPLILNPAETRNLIVRFTPASGTADTTISATLDITSDDVDEPVRTVILSGSVVAAADDSVNNTLLAAQVDSNLITAASCSNVSGEVQFSSDSSSADNFKIILSHQNGETVEGAFSSAIDGAGVAAFSGIDACGLQDGVIEVLAILDKAGVVLPAFTGTPAVKNTRLLEPPVLGVVPAFTLSSSVEICGTSRTDTTVRIEGGSSVVSVKLDSATTDFCLDVPLRRNTQNTLIASAIDDLDMAPKDVATAQPVQIVQVDLADIVVANAFSRPLNIEEIDSLVAEGVIDLNEAENFNVSMFTVVLTIGSFPVTITQPVVVNPISGTVSYGRFRSGGGAISFGGWTGGGGAAPAPPRSGGCVSGCAQIVVVKTETGQTIPGVIIIDGRIKTLKEFFQVGLALFNTSGIFILSDMNASIDVPGGLTPIRAGVGLDVNDINLDGAVDSVLIGEIAPGETGIAQFLVRGDGIGTHRIDVEFDGSITGGGLPAAIPVSGSARTTVEVLGPPELRVEVSFPSNPTGPDVIQDEIYTLIVDITNASDRPALYTSLELFVGGDAELVDENGDPIPDSSRITSFGTVLPDETQSVSFRVKSRVEGEIIACQAVASENIILTIDTGPVGAACNILNTLPANFVPLPADAAPTVVAINPLNGEPNIPLTSSVFATFTPPTACIVADTWTNVVTDNIDPTDPSKGLEVISADLVAAGTFYLEELDWLGNPIKHVPTDLTVVDPPAGGTTIAVLRLGLDAPHPNSQYFLQPDTAYRATIIGGADGVCSAASGREMDTTFSWTFTTVETCNVLEPPSVTMLDPTNGSIDRPLDQQIVLEFTNRNKDTGVDSHAMMNVDSFTFDVADFAASTFGVYANAVEAGGDITGGTAVAGTFEFSASDSILTFIPEPGALASGDVIHVRLTDRLNDVCANPVQTPPIGVKLFKFDVVDSVLPEQTIFDLSARAKDSKIDIVWTPVDGAASYNVYRSTTPGGPYSLVIEGHVTDYAVYADFGLTNGVTYYYVVRSVSDGVESLDSNEASATPSVRRRRR